MSDLVKRLRESKYIDSLDAADRIEQLERELADMTANAENLYERLRFADTFIKGELGGLRNPSRTSAIAAHKKLMEGK